MSAPEPPSICSACGRDLPVSATSCRCLGASEAWVSGERLALVGRRWRTAGGAEATTYFGRLSTAQGRGRVSFAELVAPHYGDLRGDLVFALGDFVPLRDPPVDALMAALLGGAARGVITLRGVRDVTWSRRRKQLRMESGQRGFDDVSVERVGLLLPDDDRLLAALFASAEPRMTGYRGETAALTVDVPEGPLGITTLLSRAVPRDDLPQSWVAARSTERMATAIAERTRTLLTEAWRDEHLRFLVEELTRHLRFAVRSAIADRSVPP